MSAAQDDGIGCREYTVLDLCTRVAKNGTSSTTSQTVTRATFTGRPLVAATPSARIGYVGALLKRPKIPPKRINEPTPNWRSGCWRATGLSAAATRKLTVRLAALRRAVPRLPHRMSDEGCRLWRRSAGNRTRVQSVPVPLYCGPRARVIFRSSRLRTCKATISTSIYAATP